MRYRICSAWITITAGMLLGSGAVLGQKSVRPTDPWSHTRASPKLAGSSARFPIASPRERSADPGVIR